MTCPGCNKTVTRLRSLGNGVWKCDECVPDTSKPIQNADPKHFPFRTRNIRRDGREVEVKSLRHLRRLENQNGVASGPWN